jgi:hypothetical protein
MSQLVPDIGELSFGKLAGLRAMRPIVEPQKLRDFLQRESQLLCGFDEPQSLDLGLPVSMDTAGGSVRRRQ